VGHSGAIYRSAERRGNGLRSCIDRQSARRTCSLDVLGAVAGAGPSRRRGRGVAACSAHPAVIQYTLTAYRLPRVAGGRLPRRRPRRASHGALFRAREAVRRHLRLRGVRTGALPRVSRIRPARGPLRRHHRDGDAGGDGRARPVARPDAGEDLETGLARWYAPTIQIRVAARPNFRTWLPGLDRLVACLRSWFLHGIT
jgi:hypothetical protein